MFLVMCWNSQNQLHLNGNEDLASTDTSFLTELKEKEEEKRAKEEEKKAKEIEEQRRKEGKKKEQKENS